MRYAFLLFIAMPLIEIWLILKVGSLMGVVPTILLIIVTAFIGTFLLRNQGLMTLFRAREKMNMGTMPAQEMAEGVMLAFAGALLLTPGFVTDAVGFLLLSGAVRAWVIQRFSGHIQVVGAGQPTGQRASSRAETTILEGEFRREEEH